MQELLRLNFSLSQLLYLFSVYVTNNRRGLVAAPSIRTGCSDGTLFSFDSCKEFGTPRDSKCQSNDQFWRKLCPFLSLVKMLPSVPCNQQQNALAWTFYRNKQFH